MAGAHTKGADYPKHIMDSVFGKGGKKGRQGYGLRFAPCESTELLDYNGAQLLLISTGREGDEGLEVSLGEGRGKALANKENEEAAEQPHDIVFRELAIDAEKFPAGALSGEWL